MASFLDTDGVVLNLTRLIGQSRNILVLITPYLSYIPDQIISDIKEAISRGVKVLLIFRAVESIHVKEISKLRSLTGVDMFYNPNLHAKAFYNEIEGIITSFNLSGYSQLNNIEFGVLVNRSYHPELYASLVAETEKILRTSKPIDFNRDVVDLAELTGDIFDTDGYCIRCGDKIDFDYKRPFCMDCYLVWKSYGNTTHKERYCHFCGEFKASTFDSPICFTCTDDLTILIEL